MPNCIVGRWPERFSQLIAARRNFVCAEGFSIAAIAVVGARPPEEAAFCVGFTVRPRGWLNGTATIEALAVESVVPPESNAAETPELGSTASDTVAANNMKAISAAMALNATTKCCRKTRNRMSRSFQDATKVEHQFKPIGAHSRLLIGCRPYQVGHLLCYCSEALEQELACKCPGFFAPRHRCGPIYSPTLPTGAFGVRFDASDGVVDGHVQRRAVITPGTIRNRIPGIARIGVDRA